MDLNEILTVDAYTIILLGMHTKWFLIIHFVFFSLKLFKFMFSDFFFICWGGGDIFPFNLINMLLMNLACFFVCPCIVSF